MADLKISALPASSTPLAGTEVLPIVQSSATKQVSVANLTAGRAISATQLTLTTGNVIVASGQGIDFSATPGTGTSELLADYEEGTWTPDIVNNGSASTWLTKTGYYTKIGNQVTMWYLCDNGNSGTAGTELRLSGFPFAYANNISNLQPGTILNIGGLSTFAALQMRSGTYARVVSAGNLTVDTQLTYATGTLTFQV